ncbi:MAG: peptidoglycan DD-metalloendopeptidase family protein [Fibrobacter sp.]|nr:peptidoglycan DD-metalloendopeptidase family protein [Fibrobacter sp.]
MRVIFYYRDKKVSPLFRRIATDTTAYIYFRALAVYSLGECGNSNDLNLLIRLLHTKNPLFREYVASAIGKLNDSVDVHPISGLLNKERNVFVRKTLEAASRGSRTKGHYLKSTVLDKNSTLKKIPFYPCENSPADTVSVSIIDSETKQIPVAKRCVPPHMQYKSNKSLYELIEFPLRSFGIKDQWGIHVGDDSGWLFPGLPIHAILDGIVVRIQHEQSWGNLVAVESRLCDNSPVTVYYGHLSSYICVKTGDIVKSGELIGETALSFTVDNGGYLAHLHLGIEKVKHSEAQIKGWSFTDERWINPIDFINNYSSGCSAK